MTKLKFIIVSIFFVFISTQYLNSSDPVTKNNGKEEVSACEVINNLPREELSKEEKTALLMMIEEEKLARDVYITLGEKYDQKVFKNISEAENRHMDALICLFEKYDLKNPVEGKAIGEFSNRKFQDMYESLVIRGKTDLTEALKTGASIEDLDIYDLNKLLESRTTDNADLKAVFKELVRGSRNHMRAFTKNLKKQNATYTVQHIDQKQYKAIINADQERGGWLCGDEKPKDSRKKACKEGKEACCKKDGGKDSEKHNCNGKGHQHGKH